MSRGEQLLHVLVNLFKAAKKKQDGMITLETPVLEEKEVKSMNDDNYIKIGALAWQHLMQEEGQNKTAAIGGLNKKRNLGLLLGLLGLGAHVISPSKRKLEPPVTEYKPEPPVTEYKPEPYLGFQSNKDLDDPNVLTKDKLDRISNPQSMDTGLYFEPPKYGLERLAQSYKAFPRDVSAVTSMALEKVFGSVEDFMGKVKLKADDAAEAYLNLLGIENPVKTKLRQANERLQKEVAAQE